MRAEGVGGQRPVEGREAVGRGRTSDAETAQRKRRLDGRNARGAMAKMKRPMAAPPPPPGSQTHPERGRHVVSCSEKKVQRTTAAAAMRVIRSSGSSARAALVKTSRARWGDSAAAVKKSRH